MASGPDPMTPAQRKAICDAWDKLCEHFDEVLLVINWETPDNDDEGRLTEAHEGFWHGGAMTAVGMAEFAKTRIMQSGHKYHEPE